MGVIAEGIPRGCQGLFTPVSLGYPLSVFNKNSTFKGTEPYGTKNTFIGNIYILHLLQLAISRRCIRRIFCWISSAHILAPFTMDIHKEDTCLLDIFCPDSCTFYNHVQGAWLFAGYLLPRFLHIHRWNLQRIFAEDACGELTLC